jgi:hypothetical protein
VSLGRSLIVTNCVAALALLRVPKQLPVHAVWRLCTVPGSVWHPAATLSVSTSFVGVGPVHLRSLHVLIRHPVVNCGWREGDWLEAGVATGLLAQ